MCLKRCPRSHRSFKRSFRKSHFFDFLRILDCANMSAFDKAGECSTLPLYTPSAPCPKYSCNPACDEQTLQQTPRITASGPRPTGTYTTKSGGVIVTLFDQANDAELPTYGRCGVVNGTIYCQNHELVSQVVVKIEGEMEFTSTEGSAGYIGLLNDRQKVWSGKPKGSTCPILIPFSCVLPSTFHHGDTKQPLPPSYISHHPNVSSVSLRSYYSIHVYVEGACHRKVGFLRKRKHIRIPFNYYPRTRAHHPIVPSPGFFSTIKTSPEEWYQATSPMRIQSHSQLEPIHAHLFIPAARVYSVTDNIPFHLQLSGSLPSLQVFLDPPSKENTVIGVNLVRQVVIETRYKTASQYILLARGKLSEIPPLASSPSEPQDSIHLDWEGEVRCSSDTSVGGFIAGNVSVKDFIVLDIKPHRHGLLASASPFLPHQVLVPIRIVTDPYLQEIDYHDLTS